MSDNAVPFAGREAELSEADALLRQAKRVTILCLDGPGGVGKTRLLQEFARQHEKDPGVISTGVLDFDAPALRLPSNLYLEIARRLGETEFSDYLDQVKAWHRMRRSGVGYDLLSQEEQNLKATFARCYGALAQEKRLLVLIDTLEKVQDSSVWNTLVELIALASNTLLVLAGRRNVELQAALKQRFPDQDIQLEKIGPLSHDAAVSYLQAKEQGLHVNFTTDLKEKIIAITGGKPILIDLASEWLARNIPLPWLTDLSVESLAALAPDERAEKIAEFEEELINPIRSLARPMNEVTLNLAYVYPQDRDSLSYLLGLADPAPIIEELNRMVFVKRLPDDSYALHDEMRDLVNTYVWDYIDHTRTRRREISQHVVEYCDKKIGEGEGQIGISDGETETVGAFLRRQLLQQQIGALQELRLHHLLRVDLPAGYESFLQLFEAATRDYQYALREPYLREIQEVLDAPRKFARPLNDDEAYQVKLNWARYWLDTGVQDNIRLAQRSLLSLRECYADGGLREVDLLTRLANCSIKLGEAHQAIEPLQRADEIVRTRAPKWIDRIETTLGLTYRILGQLDKAHEAYLSALTSVDDEATMATLYNNLSYAEVLRGEYEAALEYCQESLELREALGLKRELGMSYTTMADIYRYWGRYQEALNYVEKALAIFEPSGDREWLAKIYTLRGAIYRIQESYPRATEELNKALQQGVITEQPYSTHVLGCVYWNLKQYDEALQLFAESDQLATTIQDMRSRVNNLVGTAEIYLEKWYAENHLTKYRRIIENNAAELERIWQQGYQFFHHVGRMQRVMGDLSYAEGDYDEAFRHYARGYALLGGRYAGYGRRTFQQELSELETRLKRLPPEQTIHWCDYLEHAWANPQEDIRKRGELVAMCNRVRSRARLRLSHPQPDDQANLGE